MSILKIHMTYQCTAECDHCRFKCTTKPTSVIDFDMAMKCVTELKKLNDLNLVVLLGGEPGFFPDLTHAMTTAIRQLDIAVRVETNAFWAVSEEQASDFLKLLYALDASIMFSLDAFHERFIPLTHIENAIKASSKLGGQYCFEVAYLECSHRNHPIDRRTDELLMIMAKRFEQFSSCQIYKGNIFFNGRAAVKLADIVATNRGIPEEVCTSVPWWRHGDLDTLELLILDSEGYLSKGCGIAIANVQETSIPQIIRSFDARKHPIFSKLLEVGPLGLAKEAEVLGYILKNDYADKCHLCQEIREVLQSQYSEFLVPSQHYTKEK